MIMGDFWELTNAMQPHLLIQMILKNLYMKLLKLVTQLILTMRGRYLTLFGLPE